MRSYFVESIVDMFIIIDMKFPGGNSANTATDKQYQYEPDNSFLIYFDVKGHFPRPGFHLLAFFYLNFFETFILYLVKRKAPIANSLRLAPVSIFNFIFNELCIIDL